MKRINSVALTSRARVGTVTVEETRLVKEWQDNSKFHESSATADRFQLFQGELTITHWVFL